jgi:hypothetical protein
MGLAEGTLDFLGKPKIVMRKLNVHYQLHKGHISVTYRYDSKYMLIKPVIFSCVIFIMYLFTIIIQRVQVTFEDIEPAKKQK